MIEAIAIAVSGIVRFIDGADIGIPNGVRVAAFYALAIGGAYYGGYEWWSLWIGGWAATSMIVGHTKWENPLWQALRFGIPAVIAGLPAGVLALAYGAMCASAGASYVLIAKADRWLPRWWIADGPEAYHRILMGASVIGGCWIL